MKRSKKLLVVLAVVMLVIAMSSTGFAANLKRSLAVTYRDIKIYYNGMLRNFQNEPFIVDEQGRTYLPVNDMALLFDKTISWDNATSSINITDKPGQGNTVEMYNQILTLQQQVTKLESENKKLKDQLEEEESLSLKDLAKDFLKRYDELDSLDVVDIKLKGDEDDIEVQIYLDLEKNSDYEDWLDFEEDKYFEDDVEDYLQDIVDDILDEKEYEDADIEGFIEDEYSGDELVSFTVNKKGKVVLD